MLKTVKLLGLGMVMLVAAACATTTAPVTSAPTATAVVGPGSSTSQVLRANLGGGPQSLDPRLATALPEFSVIRQVFQGLLGFDSGLQPTPVVASVVPSVANGGISEDGLTYTFTLRDDVTWSDGEQVTAHDFAYAMKRLLDPMVAAPYSFFYMQIAGAPEYVGAVEADETTRMTLRDAVAVEAMDDLTLQVTLAGPNPTFLQKMALTAVYPVRQDVVEAHGAEWTEAANYLGNGPYMLDEWVHQDHITLKANPNYWGDAPMLSTITYRMITDPNAQLASYRNGELDISQVPPGLERAVLADPTLSAELVRAPQLFTSGLFFNTTVAPFDNVLVRRAFATALNRGAWIENVRNGVGEPATSWLPPEMPGFDPALGAEYTFDPVRARQLLVEAGYAEGEFPDVTYTFIAPGDGALIAEFIQAQIEDNLGVNVALEPLDPPSFFQQVVGARAFQMTGTGWGADYPDPENFLAPLFMSASGNNISGYNSAEFNELAGAASVELDQAVRLALWADAHRVLVREVPVAPFSHGVRFFLLKPEVRGLTMTAIDGAVPGDTSLAHVYLED